MAGGSTYGQGWVSPANDNYSANLPTIAAQNNSINQNSGGGGSSAGATAMVMSSLVSLIGVAGVLEDQKARSKIIDRNIENSARSFSYTQNQRAQEVEDLNRVLGDKLSSSGLEELKTEAKLKAASAETGSTRNEEAIQTAAVNKLHRDSYLYKENEVAISSTLSATVADRLNFENSMESILTGRQSSVSAGLQALNASISGTRTALGYMSDSQQESWYNTNTTG